MTSTNEEKKTNNNSFFKATIITIFMLFCIYAAYIVLLWVGSGYDSNFLSIDSCLDRGGRWNEKVLACEYE